MRLLAIFILFAAFGLTTTGCSKEEPKQAKGDPLKGVTFDKPKPEPEPPPAPPPQPGLQVKGNPVPKGLVQNVRAAALRPMRQNELKQIGLFFATFADEHGGKGPRTEEEFIDYIQRDARDIAQAIKEKYYILNLKVNLRDANAVIAYESLRDGLGYQAVRVGGSVEPVSEEDLNKLVLQQ